MQTFKKSLRFIVVIFIGLVLSCFAVLLYWLWMASQPNTQNTLGVMYSTGARLPQDDVEAAKWFRKSAEQNDMLGQHNLGWSYASGRGVPQDDVEAVYWYRKAAEQGDAESQSALGYRYKKGLGGIEQNYTKPLNGSTWPLSKVQPTDKLISGLCLKKVMGLNKIILRPLNVTAKRQSKVWQGDRIDSG